jgi:hypothetical protein
MPKCDFCEREVESLERYLKPCAKYVCDEESIAFDVCRECIIYDIFPIDLAKYNLKILWESDSFVLNNSETGLFIYCEPGSNKLTIKTDTEGEYRGRIPFSTFVIDDLIELLL